MDIMALILGYGILQGGVIALILAVKSSDNSTPNRLMSILVFLISLSLLDHWFLRTGFYLDHPQFWTGFSALSFSWGPLLYLYGYTLIHHRFKPGMLIHFVPVVILVVAQQASYRPHSLEEKELFQQFLWSEPSQELLAAVRAFVPGFWLAVIKWHVQGTLAVLSLAGYCVSLLVMLRKHDSRLEHHYSSVEDINLRWLQVLIALCLSYVLIYFLFNRAQVFTFGYFDSEAVLPSAPSIFLVFMFYTMGVAAIFQSNLVRRPVREVLDASDNTLQAGSDTQVKAVSAENEEAAPAEASSEQTSETGTQAKYTRSSLSREDADSYKARLLEAMEQQRYYLDSDLTLADLAEHTGLTRHQVSQVINERLQKKFFSFVNYYRVEQAKVLMEDPATSNMPVVELALEVGFKSRSSFFKAFKKETGMSPTQFKQLQAGGDSTVA